MLSVTFSPQKGISQLKYARIPERLTTKQTLFGMDVLLSRVYSLGKLSPQSVYFLGAVALTFFWCPNSFREDKFQIELKSGWVQYRKLT